MQVYWVEEYPLFLTNSHLPSSQNGILFETRVLGIQLVKDLRIKSS